VFILFLLLLFDSCAGGVSDRPAFARNVHGSTFNMAQCFKQFFVLSNCMQSQKKHVFCRLLLQIISWYAIASVPARRHPLRDFTATVAHCSNKRQLAVDAQQVGSDVCALRPQ
jgi:hypothetical protein